MADNIVQGLFGMTPESYQLQQDQAAQAQALQYAQMNPYQRAAYGMYLGGNRLGGAIGGALGAQDPMLQMIAKQQELLKTINPNDPKSLAQGAQAAAQFSPQLAAALAKQSNDLQASLVKQAQDLASANKAVAETGKIGTEQAATKANIKQLMTQFDMTEEQAKGIASNPDLLKSYLTPKSAQAFKLLESGKFTPESLAKWEKGEGQPELVDLAAKPGEDWLRAARSLGLPARSSYNAYTPEQVSAVNKEVFNQDIQKRAAGAIAIKVPLGDLMERAFNEPERRKSGELWAQAGEAYKAGAGTLNLLDTFEKTAQSGFTGTGAPAKLALSKALSGLGVKISDKATDTEISNALSSQLVQQIAKVFPGSQSNKELDQLLQSKPNISQELPTILRLINKMKTEVQAKQKTYEQGAALSPEERAKWNPNIAEVGIYNQLNRYNDLVKKYNGGTISDAERAEAKKIKDDLKL